LYGQLVKRRKRQKVVFTTTRMVWGARADLTVAYAVHGFSHCIQTAFIEWVNLTLRQSIAPLTRKTWSLPRSDAHLLRHVEWGRAYFTFVARISRCPMDHGQGHGLGTHRPRLDYSGVRQYPIHYLTRDGFCLAPGQTPGHAKQIGFGLSIFFRKIFYTSIPATYQA